MADQHEQSGCLGIILAIFGVKPTQSPDAKYRQRDDFLSDAELSFFQVVRECAGDGMVVLAKVRLADLFFVPDMKSNYAAFNRIAKKHVDFVVCALPRMRPVAGIELDDSSHSRCGERDAFVGEVFAAAGLPLLRFPAARTYSPEEIRTALAGILAVPQAAPAVPPSETEASAEQPVGTAFLEPLCPKCAVPMVRRVAKKGDRSGEEFWGCPNYPRCRETVT